MAAAYLLARATVKTKRWQWLIEFHFLWASNPFCPNFEADKPQCQQFDHLDSQKFLLRFPPDPPFPTITYLTPGSIVLICQLHWLWYILFFIKFTIALILRFLYNVHGLCTNQLMVQCDDQFQLLILSSSSSYNVTNVSRDDTSSHSNCAQCLQSNCLAASLSKSFSPLSRFIKCLALLEIVAALLCTIGTTL